MNQPVQGPTAYDVFQAAAIILVCLAAAVFLHLGAGAEPPDGPGGSAQLALPAAQASTVESD